MIGPTAPLFGIVWYYLMAVSKESSIYVVFGRPGAGKTTVANVAVEKLLKLCDDDTTSTTNKKVLGLDLDVCVPDWMKENFSNGIYPTLEQRNEFAKDCCIYVEQEQKKKEQASTSTTTTAAAVLSVVSFSFVNTDLRDIFREKFPNAEWFLVDTSQEEANRRIQLREGHFYNQESSGEKEEKEAEVDDADDDDDENSDWNFAPVTFPHVILDGNDGIESNADKIVKLIQEYEREEAA